MLEHIRTAMGREEANLVLDLTREPDRMAARQPLHLFLTPIRRLPLLCMLLGHMAITINLLVIRTYRLVMLHMRNTTPRLGISNIHPSNTIQVLQWAARLSLEQQLAEAIPRHSQRRRRGTPPAYW